MITLPKIIVDGGYAIATRDELLFGRIVIRASEGSPNSTPEEIEEHHAAILAGMRERVRRHEGPYVIYDPFDDEDGWMLVGELDEVIDETVEMLRGLHE